MFEQPPVHPGEWHRHEAIRRIVRATRLRGIQVDEDELYRALESNLSLCRSGKFDLSPSQRKRRSVKLEKAVKTAKYLLQQLSDEDTIRILSSPRSWRAMKSNVDPWDYLNRLANGLSEIADDQATPIVNNRLTRVFTDRSLFEAFVGLGLPNIFREHFKREPGASRTNEEKAGGPFIRFVSQTLNEFQVFKPNGLPYAAEAIAKAYYLAAGGIIRRRPRRKALGKE